MNSLKVVFGGSVNGIAAAYFIWARMVYWPYVVIMAWPRWWADTAARGWRADRAHGRAAYRDRRRIRHGGFAVHQKVANFPRVGTYLT